MPHIAPPSTPRPIQGCLLLLVLAVAWVGWADPSAATPERGEVRANLLRAIPGDSATAYGMASRAALDSARALVAPLRETAEVLGEPALRARVMTLGVAIDLQSGSAGDAVEKQLEAERLAESARDTMTWMWSMRVEAMARNYRGQHADAERLARRWMDLAARTGSAEYEAWGRTMLGYLDLYVKGDLESAKRELEASAAQFEKIQHPIGLPYTLNLLGGALMGLGEYPEAREVYEKVLAAGRKIGNARLQGYALGNLATWEARFGDPAVSLLRHREAIVLWKGMGDDTSQLVEVSNLIVVALSLGRLDEAYAMAKDAVALAESKQMGFEIPWQRGSLGDVLASMGRTEEAKATWRSVIAMGDSVAVEPRGTAAYGLATTLLAQDSVAAARAVATGALRMLGPNADVELTGKLGVLAAQLDDLGGDPRAAWERARALGEKLYESHMLELSLAAWTRAAISARHAGRIAEARDAVDRAEAIWEEGRSVASDLEFREMRGEQARALALERLRIETRSVASPDGGEALASAIAHYERFRTRTLIERMAGAHAFSDRATAVLLEPISDVKAFQERVLRDGDLLIEYGSGLDSTAVIAVTRTHRRLVWIPGEKFLGSRLDLALGLFESPPRGVAPAGIDSAAARLGALLFAGVEDLVATSARIWISPDGPLHRVPFGALRPPGSTMALLEDHQVAIVPSISVLALLRERPVASSGKLLVFEGGASRNRPALPGARRESRDLARRFLEVRVIRAGDPKRPLTIAEMENRAALHFAAHARVDAQAPWRSGVVLGSAVDGEDSLLTAESIAASRLGSPLVVLSSCETAGGRARAGEGVAGLGAAFLAAGSPAVVATLWPVDDRTTSRLMETFYAALSKGATAAAALRDAQRFVRSVPATSAPFYWAGFVLVGDGEHGLTLRAKPFWMQLPFAGAIVVILIVVATRARRSRRRNS